MVCGYNDKEEENVETTYLWSYRVRNMFISFRLQIWWK